MATLFEKIAAGEIPGDIVYRDDICFVLQDIAPQAPTHLLIIPFQPLKSVAEAREKDAALLGHLLLVVQKMAQKYAEDGNFRTIINSGERAGQSVPHLHIHLLAGRDFSWPPG
ncbi:MAG: histidine triad nucleotide-binding protein [Puniceicoccales bacterium]|jgi:histidine triad (HIT) family protein|nr:histidine triad nucleotide-binding protein [Puniceicoccales bacterium]